MDEAIYRDWFRTYAALSEAIADLKYELACRRFVADLKRAEGKANFNPAQPRAPRGSPTGGEWTDDGGSAPASPPASARPRFTPAQFRPPGGGRRGGSFSDPVTQFRLDTYNRARNEIRRFEPTNPQLQTLAPPNYIPDARTVNRVSRELEAVRDRSADGISGHGAVRGHGAGFGGASRLDLYTIVRRTISDPTVRIESLPRGRTLYYDRTTNTLVIVDPNSPSGGTVYRPPGGKRYVDELVRKR